MGTVLVTQRPKSVISPVSTTPKETIAKNVLKDTLEYQSMEENVKVTNFATNFFEHSVFSWKVFWSY